MLSKVLVVSNLQKASSTCSSMAKTSLYQQKARIHHSRQVSTPRPAATAVATSAESELEQKVIPEESLKMKMTHDHDSKNKYQEMSTEEIASLVRKGKIANHKLEKELGDYEKGVAVRRSFLEQDTSLKSLQNLPFRHFDYNQIDGACCENVIGYVPLPVGIAGPLLIDGKLIYLPMATTEGTLVASTHRGCKAITMSGGATTSVFGDSMTRAPVIKFPTALRAAALKKWISVEENMNRVKEAFNSTSRFARLKYITSYIAGRNIYLRFKSPTGDAMGMNMISKGVEKGLEVIKAEFPDMQILSLSGNVCTDKKPAAINWIEGRGKSVVGEAVIKGEYVEKVLKTRVQDLIQLNNSKNLIGSAIAGSVGGFNAHAANIVTAMFLATGQDPAQNVESSNCMTIFESINDGKDLHISCTMPSLEVGTVGGGTHLKAQSTCLDLLGVKGSHPDTPGMNATQLARYICGGVLAGELSLMSALAAGHLVRSHLTHNRKK